MNQKDLFFIVIFIAVVGGNLLLRLIKKASGEIPAAPKIDKDIPITAQYEPPENISPVLARYIYNNYRYDDKVLKVLFCYAVAEGLLKLKFSAQENCYVLETAAPCEDFNCLPDTEREALFILLGRNFDAGRIFSFKGRRFASVEEIEQAHVFLEQTLQTDARLFIHAYQRVMGFRKYLEIGEGVRLPGVTPETAKATFVSHALEYFPYALAFDLEIKWNEYLSSDISAAYNDFLNQRDGRASFLDTLDDDRNREDLKGLY